MMMAGGGGAAVDHNGIYSNPNLLSLQQPLMEADNPDSRKRPLETPAEEAGCTKRTNVGGKRDAHQSPTVSPPHEVESGVGKKKRKKKKPLRSLVEWKQLAVPPTETTCSMEADLCRTLGA